MENFARIPTDQLQNWMKEKRDFTLIDVSPMEFYDEATFLARSRRVCAKVTFTGQVHAIEPDRHKDIVAYASSRRSRAAVAAAVKLTAAGYTNVYAYEGGTAGGSRRAAHSRGRRPPRSIWSRR